MIRRDRARDPRRRPVGGNSGSETKWTAGTLFSPALSSGLNDLTILGHIDSGQWQTCGGKLIYQTRDTT